jgi:hypothetical protein
MYKKARKSEDFISFYILWKIRSGGILVRRIFIMCLSILLLFLTSCHPNKNEINITEDFLTQLELYETANIESINELVEITKPLLNISPKAFTSLEDWDTFGSMSTQKEITLFGYQGMISITMKSDRIKAVSYTWSGSQTSEYYMVADTLVDNYGDPGTVQINADHTAMEDTTHKEILEFINNDTTDEYLTQYQWDVDGLYYLNNGYLAKNDYTALNLTSQK